MQLETQYLSKRYPLLFFKFDCYKAFIRYLWERYELRKLTIRKCKDILQACLDLSAKNKIIYYFSQFIGLDAIFMIPSSLLIYLMLIKELDITLDDFFSSNCVREFSLGNCYNKICGYFRIIV